MKTRIWKLDGGIPIYYTLDGDRWRWWLVTPSGEHIGRHCDEPLPGARRVWDDAEVAELMLLGVK